MKKQIITIGAALLFTIGSTTFIGCGNSEHDAENMHATDDVEHHDHDEMTEDHADHAHYQCPMKCEEDKTYDEAGACPKCGMDLAIVE